MSGGPTVRVGDTRFDPVVVGVASALGILAVVVTFALRDLLLRAPAVAGPLLLTVWLGPLFAYAWLRNRREAGSDEEREDPWER